MTGATAAPMEVPKAPEPTIVDRAAAAAGTEVSLLLLLVEGVMTAVTVVEPLKTPTTLTLEVSWMLRRAHRLLMKLVMVLFELKKSLMFMAKWVVSWIDSVNSICSRQSRA